MKIYYAHSIALYGTPQEKRDVAMLVGLGFEVVNPNSPESDAGYKTAGMPYFKQLLDDCDALAFRANPDGTINAGVVWQASFMLEAQKPVIELPVGIHRRTLSVQQTRAHLRESGAR